MRRHTAWHTIRQLDAETYQISEPLGAVEPRYGVRTVNMYLVLGQVRAVLLDSGMGIGDLRTLTGSITRLPLQIVNTHYHWDHSGGNVRFAQVANAHAAVQQHRAHLAEHQVHVNSSHAVTRLHRAERLANLVGFRIQLPDGMPRRLPAHAPQLSPKDGAGNGVV